MQFVFIWLEGLLKSKKATQAFWGDLFYRVFLLKDIDPDIFKSAADVAQLQSFLKYYSSRWNYQQYTVRVVLFASFKLRQEDTRDAIRVYFLRESKQLESAQCLQILNYDSVPQELFDEFLIYSGVHKIGAMTLGVPSRRCIAKNNT